MLMESFGEKEWGSSRMCMVSPLFVCQTGTKSDGLFNKHGALKFVHLLAIIFMISYF